METASAGWSPPPQLAAGVLLKLRQRLTLPRPGPGGMTPVSIVDLQAGPNRLVLAVLQREKVLARDLRAIRDQLGNAITLFLEQLPRAEAEVARAAMTPTLATDVATPSVLESALALGLAVIDQRGTVMVRQGPVFLHIEGRGRTIRDARISFFNGKSLRVVRWLLAQPFEKFTAQALAARAEISYVYAHTVLTALEQADHVSRASPRSGFELRNPASLLKAWVQHAVTHPPSIQGFYAPSTTTAALRSGDAARREAGLTGIFTLASALAPAEAHASAMPHGIYLSGDPDPMIHALKLRRASPFNFLVLRADPVDETTAGGIYLSPREWAHGPGVSLPQLAVDFAAIGGRGPEQSEFLIRQYAAFILAPREP